MALYQSPRAIYICADTNPTERSMVVYLKHELKHEQQDCVGARDATCLDRMKREIEANKAAGLDFVSSLQGAVWSSCIVKRCVPGDITDALAAAMKTYYESLP